MSNWFILHIIYTRSKHFFELNIHNRTLYVCECLKLNPPAKPLNTEKCIYESCFTFKRICIPFHPDPRLTPLCTALPGNRGDLCGVCHLKVSSLPPPHCVWPAKGEAADCWAPPLSLCPLLLSEAHNAKINLIITELHSFVSFMSVQVQL